MLPLEIIALIASHLPYSDIYACVFVSHEWHRQFLPLLYTSITLTEEQPGAYDALKQSSASLGCNVRELVMDDGIFTRNTLEQLGRLIPNITTLCFRWSHVETLSRRSTRINPTFHSCLPILSSLHTDKLKHMTLVQRDVQGSDFTGRASIGCPILDDILQHTPHLSTLALLGVIPTLRATDLDIILKYCPHLMELKLSGSNTLLTGDIEDRKAYPKVQKISLAYFGGWSMLAGWLHALAHRYPNLRELGLDNEASRAIVLRGDGTELRQAFTAFSTRLSKLEKVRLVNMDVCDFEIYKSFLAPLQNLRELVLHDRRCMDFNKLLDALSEKRVMSLDTHPSTTDFTAGRCISHLTTLAIDMTDKPFQLGTLLDSCACLKDLTVAHAHLKFSSRKQSSTLERLQLKRVKISPSTITALVQYCSNLHTFETISCRLAVADNQSPEVRLDLSARPLRSLYMTNVRIHFSEPLMNHWSPALIYGLVDVNATASAPDDTEHTRKKRRCHGPEKRWYSIPSVYPVYQSAHPTAQPSMKTRTMVLRPKVMEKVLQGNGWDPKHLYFLLNSYTQRSLLNRCLVVYYCKVKDFRINGYKMP